MQALGKRFMAWTLALLAFTVLALAGVAYAGEARLENPIKAPDIAQFTATALKVLVMIALPVISLFIVYSGFLFVAARGKEEQLRQAKQNFLYVIIGAILILGAWVIATIIGGTVADLISGSTR